MFFNEIAFTNFGAAKSFQVFNSKTTVPALTTKQTINWTTRIGSKNMVCFAAAPKALGVANNN